MCMSELNPKKYEGKRKVGIRFQEEFGLGLHGNISLFILIFFMKKYILIWFGYDDYASGVEVTTDPCSWCNLTALCPIIIQNLSRDHNWPCVILLDRFVPRIICFTVMEIHVANQHLCFPFLFFWKNPSSFLINWSNTGTYPMPEHGY